MKIKSYFARSVGEAIARASQELGPDAMLVNSRPAPLEARHLGAYEVAFATDVPVPADTVPATPDPAPPTVNGAKDRIAQEVSELKRELESMRRVLTQTAFAAQSWPAAPPAVSDAYAVLTSAEVPAELAREIIQAAEERLTGPRRPLGRLQSRTDTAALQRALVEEMESRVKAEPLLGRPEGRPRITALVGPPGAGKTTTLVKLAVNYGLASRRPVLLLSMDTYRIAAAEQLRSYAAILGVGFQVTDTVAALAQSIEENQGKDLIFIDTPGLDFDGMDAADDLRQFLSTRIDIDTQLVLPASMKAADLTRVVDAYAGFGPRRLLFTKIDETTTFGPILGEATRTGKPLSFLATGQRIPEDLEEARTARVVELVFSREPARGRTAA